MRFNVAEGSGDVPIARLRLARLDTVSERVASNFSGPGLRQPKSLDGGAE